MATLVLVLGGVALAVSKKGTGAADTLRGTPKADQIRALSGNDTIIGRGGNDTVYANQGKDAIYGGAGDDILWDGKGDDSIYRGDGDDTIYGNNGQTACAARGAPIPSWAAPEKTPSTSVAATTKRSRQLTESTTPYSFACAPIRARRIRPSRFTMMRKTSLFAAPAKLAHATISDANLSNTSLRDDRGRYRGITASQTRLAVTIRRRALVDT
jgi:hypothetical protein